MALELNGTTGVSLVQDGVVTAADLSSTLDLSGKTVTLPAGASSNVRQIVTMTHSTTEGTWNQGTYRDFPSISITPKSNNSYLLIIAECQLFRRSGDSGVAVVTGIIQDMDSNTNHTIQSWMEYADTRDTVDGLRNRQTLTAVLPNTVTTTRQFRPRFLEGNSGVGRIGSAENLSTIIIEYEA